MMKIEISLLFSRYSFFVLLGGKVLCIVHTIKFALYLYQLINCYVVCISDCRYLSVD